MNLSKGTVHENVQGYDPSHLQRHCEHEIQMAQLLGTPDLPCLVSEAVSCATWMSDVAAAAVSSDLQEGEAHLEARSFAY